MIPPLYPLRRYRSLEKSKRSISLLGRLGKLREKLNVSRINHPKFFLFIVLAAINAAFFVVAAVVIQRLLSGTAESENYGVCLYYALTMVLDAGCITNVIADIGTASTALVIACVFIVIAGMIAFTGAVIGYITTILSGIIENSNSGKWRLHVSGHTVILNWNSRASEIINDMLYSDRPETVVILSGSNPDTIRAEVEERLFDTVNTENARLREQLKDEAPAAAFWKYHRRRLSARRVSIIVREGETYSSRQLSDVAVNQAKAIVILGVDVQNAICQYGRREMQYMQLQNQGNSNLVKTAIQVADITAAASSAANQQIIVEVDDPWTRLLIDKIIAHKKTVGKNNIVPISADRILGELLSQFSIMPELSDIYSELFSNKGAAFFSRTVGEVADAAEAFDADATPGHGQFVPAFLSDHVHAIPLTCMRDNENNDVMYFMAGGDDDVDTVTPGADIAPVALSLNPGFAFTRRNVIILGHNSNSKAIMDGFNSFRSEWNYTEGVLGEREVLNITVIDDPDSLEILGQYNDYPYVSKVIPVTIYQRREILDAIRAVVQKNAGNTSILILSDDNVPSEDIDSAVLTYLIYVQEAISDFAQDSATGVDPSKIDVIVEIQNPKNYDVVQSYSASNIVISNRFISKMVTQISEKKTIFDFFSDILVYDEDAGDAFTSMELYVKPVSGFFERIPGPCTAAQLIRSVYEAGPDDNKSVVLGYVRYDPDKNRSGEVVIFSGDQTKINVALKPKDKIILFSNH